MKCKESYGFHDECMLKVNCNMYICAVSMTHLNSLSVASKNIA